jgi:zinc transporter ZupT
VLRNWFNISKAIGFILTIAGLVLAVWFIQIAALPGPAPLPNFVVAAIAAAMLMVGVRYIVKSNPRKPKPEAGKE